MALCDWEWSTVETVCAPLHVTTPEFGTDLWSKGRVDTHVKQDLANWYFNLPDCCRSQSFCKPLLSMCTCASDLVPNGRLYHTLDACFRTPPTNIQCENNFARAASSKLATRGRSDHSAQLCAKHILAEMKALHRKDIVHRVKSNSMGETETHDRAISDPVQDESVELDSSSFNFDWTWFFVFCSQIVTWNI